VEAGANTPKPIETCTAPHSHCMDLRIGYKTRQGSMAAMQIPHESNSASNE